MKNIYEILEDFGLEIPAEKKTDFEKAWKENYRTKSEYDIAVTKRDEYKSSLDTVSEQLKAFDGVDVADLNGQIKKLKMVNTLQKKQIESFLTRLRKLLRPPEDVTKKQSWLCLIWTH